MSCDRIFLKFSVDKLEQLHLRVQACLDRLTSDQIWMRGAETQNAVGNLVLHLCGNLQQWILSGVAGRPDTRDRDSEFAERKEIPIPELKSRLLSTVTDTVAVIRALSAEQLLEVRETQMYKVTVLEAVYHVVEHFAQHAAQIIFVTKLFTKEDLGFYRHLNNPQHTEKTP
jgi:uncharacterized damage-inducible protein DinB